MVLRTFEGEWSTRQEFVGRKGSERPGRRGGNSSRSTATGRGARARTVTGWSAIQRAGSREFLQKQTMRLRARREPNPRQPMVPRVAVEKKGKRRGRRAKNHKGAWVGTRKSGRGRGTSRDRGQQEQKRARGPADRTKKRTSLKPRQRRPSRLRENQPGRARNLTTLRQTIIRQRKGGGGGLVRTRIKENRRYKVTV